MQTPLMTTAPPSDLSRRERRIAARKHDILHAAAKVFSEKGYHRATMKEIAQEADIAAGTIYNYFGGKENLLLEIIDQLSERNQRAPQAEEALKYSYREIVTHGMLERMRHIDAHYYTMFLAVLPEILSTPDLRKRYYELFIKTSIEVGEKHVDARKNRGEVRDDLDTAIIVRLMHGLWLGVSIMMLLGDDELQRAWHDPERFATAVVSTMLDGVTPKTNG